MSDLINKLSAPLDMSEIDWRVGSINDKGCQLLAYKDARVDMRRLDDVCGPLWQSKYKRDSKGILQCGIGIFNNDIKEWIWRWSNGVESYAESEKGEYSDAFKRAGFMWGIGRELYDVPFTWCNFASQEEVSKNSKTGRYQATHKFQPNSWNWTIDFQNKRVTAKDSKGNVRVGFVSKQTKDPSSPIKKTNNNQSQQRKLDEIEGGVSGEVFKKIKAFIDSGDYNIEDVKKKYIVTQEIEEALTQKQSN